MGAFVGWVGDDVEGLEGECVSGAGGCCVGVVDAGEDCPLPGLLAGRVSGAVGLGFGVVEGREPDPLSGGRIGSVGAADVVVAGYEV